MAMILTEKTIDDRLLELLHGEFQTDEEQQFVLNFKLYLEYGTDNTKFVVDLDNVWEFLGFKTKGNAKRMLIKVFEENTDYILKVLLPEDKHFLNGGQNKETILMNVNTFKCFCMTANTERGKKTRNYYSKMESAFFKYYEEKQQLILKENEEKHDALLKAYEDNAEMMKIVDRSVILATAYHKKAMVYILLVMCPFIPQGTTLIKIGSSDDIQDRLTKLRDGFGCDVYILHVFPCEDNRKFEKKLFAHKFINPKNYKKPIGPKKENSTECFLLQSKSQLGVIVRICQKGVKYYKTRSLDAKPIQVELYRQELESKRLDILREQTTRLMNMYGNNTEGFVAALQQITTLFQQTVLLPEIVNEANATSEDITEATEATTEDAEATEEPTSGYGPKVQMYDGTDITKLLRVFNGITEATREVPNSSYTAIKYASKNRLIYMGYRWLLIPKDDEEPNKVRDIGPCGTLQKRTVDFTAQLSIDRTKVIALFKTQSEAADSVSQQRSTISGAIKYNRPLAGFFWTYWELVEDNLKTEYLKTNKLPTHAGKSNGVRVEQIDPETNKIIKTHMSIMDVVKEFKMSPRKIKQVMLDGSIYKDFIWNLQDPIDTKAK